jgi:uncharacterized protein YijF (DUF1287 family)
MRRKFLVLLILLPLALMASDRQRFIEAARSQVGVTLSYNPEYVRLKFPMGDIPLSKGVCTDVLVRAFRGVGIDLQERIYRHKKAHPKLYKSLYYTDRLDPNFDLGRVKNILAYLAARG